MWTDKWLLIAIVAEMAATKTYIGPIDIKMKQAKKTAGMLRVRLVTRRRTFAERCTSSGNLFKESSQLVLKDINVEKRWRREKHYLVGFGPTTSRRSLGFHFTTVL